MLQNKILIVNARAYLAGKNTILAGSERYEAENILIATGSVPAEPFVEGAVTSDELLKMDEVPKSLKIIGGGVAAVEFAHIYNCLGTDVALCIRSNRLLRRFDREISAGITQMFRKRGITIQTDCTLKEMQEKDAQVLLSATGRVPNTEHIFSNELGIQTDRGIVTDAGGRTSVAGIYAAGDVACGSPQLAHIAMEQGKRAVRSMVGEDVHGACAVVQCIYVRPEIATVGYSEAEARRQGKRVVVGKQTMSANARTMIAAAGRGFVKLVADADTGKIIGAQLMCERAGDLAAELALAIDRQLTVDELSDTVRPHPSYCEAVTEAADSLKGKLKDSPERKCGLKGSAV